MKYFLGLKSIVITLILLSACGSVKPIQLPVIDNGKKAETKAPTEIPPEEIPKTETPSTEAAHANVPQTEIQTDTQPAAEASEEIIYPEDADLSIGETDKLIVYLNDISVNGSGKETLDYLNDFLDENGFNLEYNILGTNISLCKMNRIKSNIYAIIYTITRYLYR
jgi:uncharacterized lipoprotein